MHERGGGDQGVAFRARVGDVELGAAPGDGYVHAEQPLAEPGEHPLLQPQPEHRALGGVAALDPQDADLQLQERDGREPEQAGRGVLRPGAHGGVGADALAQLRDEVGVQEVGQSRSAGRRTGPARRGGSKSMPSPPGMASASSRLGPPPRSLR